MAIDYRTVQNGDRHWLAELLREYWGGTLLVSRGRMHQAERLPGFIALDTGEPVGVLLYHLVGKQCEMVLLHSLREGRGIGTALIGMVREMARTAGCQALWLITTNDNTPALRFYQKRGFRLVAVHRDALEIARMVKPSIPRTGIDGIPLLDEIELEIAW